MTEYYYLHTNDTEECEFDIEGENCYIDENGHFEKFDEMTSKIKAKDIVYIYNIANLGNDFTDIMMRWTKIVEEKKAEVVTSSKPFIDTRKLNYSRLEYFIYLLHLSDKIDNDISYRNRVRKKQLEGISEAKEKGRRIGKPKKYTMEEFVEAYNELAQKGLMDKEISEKLGIHPSTCSRYKRIIEEGE